MSRITPASLAALTKGDVQNFIAASTPGGIEEQEKNGQRSFTAKLNSQLPIEGTSGPDRAAWEKMGFRFADKPDDELFITAEFPAGWTKLVTDHSMWSKLLDAKGRERAGIFFKAAFYDRRASVTLLRRYGCSSYHSETGHAPYSVVATDCGKVVQNFGVYQEVPQAASAALRESIFKGNDELKKRAKAWLDATYPDWENEASYWD